MDGTLWFMLVGVACGLWLMYWSMRDEGDD